MSFIKSITTLAFLTGSALSHAAVLVIDDLNGADLGRCESDYITGSCYTISSGDMLGGKRATGYDYGVVDLSGGALTYDSSQGSGPRGGYYTGGSGQYYIPTASGFTVGYGQIPYSGLSSLNLDLRPWDAIRVRLSDVKSDIRVRIGLTSLDYFQYADWSSSVLVSASDRSQDVFLPLSGFSSTQPDGERLNWSNVDSLLLSISSAEQDPSDDWASPDHYVAVSLDQIAAVPEPETYALFATGAAMLALARRRKAG